MAWWIGRVWTLRRTVAVGDDGIGVNRAVGSGYGSSGGKVGSGFSSWGSVITAGFVIATVSVAAISITAISVTTVSVNAVSVNPVPVNPVSVATVSVTSVPVASTTLPVPVVGRSQWLIGSLHAGGVKVPIINKAKLGETRYSHEKIKSKIKTMQRLKT